MSNLSKGERKKGGEWYIGKREKSRAKGDSMAVIKDLQEPPPGGLMRFVVNPAAMNGFPPPKFTPEFLHRCVHTDVQVRKSFFL